MSDMCLDLELKGRSHLSREVSGSKEPISAMKEIENDHMKHASNGEHKIFNMQVGTNKQTEGAFRNLDVGVVNLFEGTKSNDIKRVEEEKCDVDLTESSSSFDSDGTSFTDAEDNPDLYDDALSALPFDGYSEFFQMRKKKLTSSWRKYIEPLKWRCKWVELQIKKFEFQAQKYEREIAEYNRIEQLEKSKPENVNSESLPFSLQSPKKAFLKRKKRRRVEETEEISSYMSQHNLFSYFENKKYTAYAAATDGNSGNQGIAAEKSSNGTNEVGVIEELISCEFKDRGNSLEQIFWKIGVMQWQVSEMKIRVHKVLSENALRFSSNENMSVLVSCNNSLTSSTENPASLNNEDKIVTVASISSEIISDDGETKMVDLVMPKSEALSLGQVNHASENINGINSPTIGGSSRNPTGTILMYNRRAKMNPNKSKEVNIVSSQKPYGSTEDHQGSSSNIPSHHVPEPSTPNKMGSISKIMMANTTGTRSFKRKRAMRKAGSGKWNQ